MKRIFPAERSQAEQCDEELSTSIYLALGVQCNRKAIEFNALTYV